MTEDGPTQSLARIYSAGLDRQMVNTIILSYPPPETVTLPEEVDPEGVISPRTFKLKSVTVRSYMNRAVAYYEEIRLSCPVGDGSD